jgi:chemotaxis protein methyltransferase CheR
VYGAGLTLSDEEFRAFAELVHAKAGINLNSGKKELVRARLAGLVRSGSFTGLADYYDYIINDPTGDELVRLLDAISTNLTSFFRESKHFRFMVERFLPTLIQEKTKTKRLRIWSAGCSTGEEPYSIVMTVFEYFPKPFQSDFKVLGTDLSTRVLQSARAGVYSSDAVREIPVSILRRYFLRGDGKWTGYYRLSPHVRDSVVFRRLNLIEPFPFRHAFDLIFCRNVMIYFDKKLQADLVARMYRVLEPGGYLFIGHAESLSGINRQFTYIEPTVYRRPLS